MVEGGAPAGVKDFDDEGGGPAGVVEGLSLKPKSCLERFSLPGVEGGLEEYGTAKVLGMLMRTCLCATYASGTDGEHWRLHGIVVLFAQ